MKSVGPMEVIVCPTRAVGVCPPLSSLCHVIASRSSAHISLHGACRPVCNPPKTCRSLLTRAAEARWSGGASSGLLTAACSHTHRAVSKR